jgi:hypothetical protein
MDGIVFFYLFYWEKNDLEIMSRSNTGKNYFEVEYLYDRGGWNRFWGTASNYHKGDVVSYGMYTFSSSVTAWVDVSHKVVFDDIADYRRDTITASFTF